MVSAFLNKAVPSADASRNYSLQLENSGYFQALRGASGLDVYGWLGSLATYGFIVTYALVSISLPRYLRDMGALHSGSQFIPIFAFIAMLLVLAGNLYPIPEGPYGKLPLIYLAYLAVGMVWFFAGWSRKPAAISES
jgi:hypothetical protein